VKQLSRGIPDRRERGRRKDKEKEERAGEGGGI
jgi:hypothetical protein